MSPHTPATPATPANPDIHALCEALCEGALDAAGSAALQRLVLTDTDARRTYIRRTHLHTALYRAVDPASVPAPLPTDTPATHRPIRRRHRAAFAIAAALVAIIGAWAYTAWPRDTPVTAPPLAHSPTVATMTHAMATLTDEHGDPVYPGADMTAGAYTLASGSVELFTASGANLQFKGPAAFTLAAPNRLTLTRGSVLIDVPTAAGSIAVRAAQLDIVDLGTRFAVSTDGVWAHVHVFEGAVQIHDGDATPATLHAGESARAVRGQSARPIDAQPIEAFAAVDPAPRALLNADFEQAGDRPFDLPGWTSFGVVNPDDPNVRREAEPIVTAHAGSHVAKVFGRFEPGHVFSGLYQHVRVEPGRRCVGGVHVAHQSGDALAGANAAWCKLEFFNEAGDLLAQHDSPDRLTADSPIDAYHRLAVDAVAPPGAAAVRFVLIFEQDHNQSPGAALFDDAALSLQPQPLSPENQP